MNENKPNQIVKVLENNIPVIIAGVVYVMTFAAFRQFLKGMNPKLAAIVITPSDIERLKLGKQFLDFRGPLGDIIRVDYIPAS